MAAGEYVSVSSQRDSEEADIRLEDRELHEDPAGELVELTRIYQRRGLSSELALTVAQELTRADPLAAHVRDELGLEDARRARPLQAAWASALSFSAGAALPLIAVVATPPVAREAVTVAATLIALAILGDVGARLGGASRLVATSRVVVWGAVAMAVTAAIGAVIGTI